MHKALNTLIPGARLYLAKMFKIDKCKLGLGKTTDSSMQCNAIMCFSIQYRLIKPYESARL